MGGSAHHDGHRAAPVADLAPDWQHDLVPTRGVRRGALVRAIAVAELDPRVRHGRMPCVAQRIVLHDLVLRILAGGNTVDSEFSQRD